jgi:transcriptional regulator
MANRPKTERNKKILEYWDKGYRQKSIANMFKMSLSAVSMVIWRAKHDGKPEPLPERTESQIKS